MGGGVVEDLGGDGVNGTTNEPRKETRKSVRVKKSSPGYREVERFVAS